MKKTNNIALPTWLSGPPSKYVTRSGGKMAPDDVALRLALSICLNNCADALRRLARRLVDSVPMEQQPKLKKLSREPDDSKVFDEAIRIINRVCDVLQWAPGFTFKREPTGYGNADQHLTQPGALEWDAGPGAPKP